VLEPAELVLRKLPGRADTSFVNIAVDTAGQVGTGRVSETSLRLFRNGTSAIRGVCFLADTLLLKVDNPGSGPMKLEDLDAQHASLYRILNDISEARIGGHPVIPARPAV
jgi:hypothetical protein